MKKTLAIATLLILVGALSIPFVSGLLMEKYLRRAFEQANALYAETGSGYSLEVVSYERGYRTSHIQWKFNLGALASISGTETIVFEDHARHGFSGVVSTSNLKKNPWYTAFVDGHLGGHDPLHLSTAVDLWGGIASTLTLDAFSITSEEGKIDVHPGRLVFKTDPTLTHLSTSGTWDGLKVGDTITIGSASLAGALEKLSTYLWNGDLRFDLKGFDAHGGEARLAVGSLTGRHLLKISDDRAVASLETRLAANDVQTEAMAVADASIGLAISGIDVQGYEGFMRLYTRNMQQLLEEMAAEEEPSAEAGERIREQLAMMGIQMMAAYEQLLKKGLEIRISDCKATLPDGQVSGAMTLRLLKDMTFMQFAPVVSQPELLFDIFYLKSDLDLPVSLVGETPNLLSPAFPGMQTGLFVKSGDRLVHRAETVDGGLLLNGSPVVLP